MQLGVAGETRYDTAAQVREGRRENAWSLRVGPRVSARRSHGRLRYDVEYAGFYEQFLDLEGKETFDHILDANASWSLDPRTTISFTDDFRRIQGPTSLVAPEEGVPEATDVDLAANTIIRNAAKVSIVHAFRPGLQGNVVATHFLSDFDTEQNFDNSVLRGNAFLAWQARPRHRLELGLSSSYQTVEGNQSQPGSRTTTHQAFVGWGYDVTQRLNLHVRGGPALVRNSERPAAGQGVEVGRFPTQSFLDVAPGGEVFFQQGVFDIDTCDVVNGRRLASTCSRLQQDLVVQDLDGTPVLRADPASGEVLDRSTILDVTSTSGVPIEEAGSDEGSRVTFFAEASLSWSHRNWDASLRYRRTEEPTSTSGGSTSVDALTGQLRWRPTRLWRLAGTASWSRRLSTSEQRILSDVVVGDSMIDGLRPDGSVASVAEITRLATVGTDNAIDLTNWALVGRATRRLTEHFSATLEVRYSEQTQDGDLGTVADNRRLLGLLRLTWDLKPLRF